MRREGSHVNRRHFLAGTSAAVAAIALAACGDEESKQSEKSSESGSDPASSKGGEGDSVESSHDLTADKPFMAFGKEDASKKLELFVDYLCPHCKHFADTNGDYLKEIADSGEVLLHVYVRPMLDAHTGGTYSLDTASCALAAYEQDPASFWKMDNALFGMQPGPEDDALPSQDDIYATATKAGLSDESLAKVKEGMYEDIANAAEKVGQERQIGTPVLYINGTEFSGDFTVDGEVKKAVEAAK